MCTGKSKVMRVICISNKWEPAPEAVNDPRPEIGDIDTVVKDFMHDSHRFYEIERFRDTYYGAEMFATLPDTPAEVVEETELQTA